MIRSEKSAGFSDSDSCAEEEDEANPTCSPICRNRAKDSAISFSMIIVGGMKMGIMIGKTKRNNRIAKKRSGLSRPTGNWMRSPSLSRPHLQLISEPSSHHSDGYSAGSRRIHSDCHEYGSPFHSCTHLPFNPSSNSHSPKTHSQSS